jgi:hypothetical protein
MLLNGLYNTGVVTLGASANVKGGAEINMGGCVGQAYFGNIKNCYNGSSEDTTHAQGKVVLNYKNNKAHVYMGGVGGYIRVYSGSIHENLYNYANIETANDFTLKSHRLRLGGAFGWTYKTAITKAYNYGNINITSTATDVSNQFYIGGCVGRNDAGYTDMAFAIVENYGNITIDATPSAGAARAIGGVYATAEYAATFSQLVNKGDITLTAKVTDGATSSVGIGGLIGLPTKAITIDQSEVDCTISTAHTNAGMAVGLPYGGLATVTNSKIDGALLRSDKTIDDINIDNFFDYIYTSAWGGDTDYAGNTGVKTAGGESSDDL